MKEKKLRVRIRVLTSNVKCEMRRKFQVVVVQWRQWNVPKSVMHMWSCCFSFQTSCCFGLSRSRRCLLNFWVLISQDPHRELRGKNVLIVRRSLQDTARLVDVDEAVLKEQLARAREILFEERKNRPPPHLDTKMITAWNGEGAFFFMVVCFYYRT